MKQWYEELFENYAKTYDNEVFTQGTIGECDFLERELGGDKTRKILDVGCGTGRHAIELARRGYAVTGIDWSESQLRRAREKASEQKVEVSFQRHDARKPHFDNAFDLVIMLCEGGFPLMETDEMNFQILKRATAALRSPGKFIFTTLNGLFPLFHSVKDFLEAEKNDSGSAYQENPFDLMTFRQQSQSEFVDDDGKKKLLSCNERFYVPSEISWLLASLGLKNIGIYGARLGQFSRDDPLTTEDFEMLVIAEKEKTV